jgi:hypothetical protein
MLFSPRPLKISMNIECSKCVWVHWKKKDGVKRNLFLMLKRFSDLTRILNPFLVSYDTIQIFKNPYSINMKSFKEFHKVLYETLENTKSFAVLYETSRIFLGFWEIFVKVSYKTAKPLVFSRVSYQTLWNA